LRRDTGAVESGVAYELPVGRHLAMDDRGIGLRATWRLDHGFINLSLWRDGECVETFHLTPAAAAELVGFLAKGLADATTVATMAHLEAIDAARRPEPRAADRLVDRARTVSRSARTRVAGVLGRAADRIDT
jgi:hypothetical protein